MMQIGGVDNLVLKQVKLPSEFEEEDRKVRLQEDQNKASEDTKAQREADSARDEEVEKSTYGDVVGRSSDGDTTRVKQNAVEALETGMVFRKEDQGESLMEFNRDQLTAMLDRGDITDNQYDHEISRRDEIMEKDEESAFAKSNAEMIEKQKEEAEKKAQEKAKERLDELQGKNDKENGNNNAVTNVNEEKEEDENGNIRRLENGMNMLAAGEKSLEIEEDAVNTAAQNGRSEIIDQILNPEEGSLKVIIQ